MPIRAWIEKDRRRVRAAISGAVGMADILRAIDESVAHPDFERGFDVLSDHTEVTRVITVGQLREMVAHLESLAPQMAGARWAVATRRPASYGMMRMLSVYAERVPMTVEVFDSLVEAEAWLDALATPAPRVRP
ncbi:MAG: hypothetical protein R3263_07855 [Myxococcota bacterium]|nr:hypothetical protein [Myxococcota bacterium]